VAAKNTTIAELKQQNAQLEASHARTVAAKDAIIAQLEREHAALKADAAAKLALEVHTVRCDRRQFVRCTPAPCRSIL
jgi:hypothetical protein